MDLKILQLFCSSLHLFLSVCKGQDCPPQYVGATGKIVFLSQHHSSAVLAEASCEANGTQLAHVTDQPSYSRVLQTATQLYAADLVIVWMYVSARDPNLFRYSQAKITSNQGWNPMTYNNKQFYFHLKSRAESGLVAVRFCRDAGRTKWSVLVGTVCRTNKGWFEDFTLYGSGSFLPGTKRLLIYTHLSSGGRKASPTTIRNLEFKLYNRTVYYYDVNLLLGSAPAPSRGQVQCSPSVLHYGESWSDVCDRDVNDTAFYACQYTFTASASYDCLGLNVKWMGNLQNIPSTNNGEGITVEMSVAGTALFTSVPYNDRSYTFKDLPVYANHQITLTAMLNACNDVNATTTIQVASLRKTSTLRETYVISTQQVNVTQANCVMTVSGDVSPQTGFCRLEVDASNRNLHQFQVSNSKNSFRFRLPESDVGSAVDFTILAYGTFTYVPQHRVTVQCSKPTTEAATKQPNGALIGALVAVVLLLIIAAMFLLFYYKKRRNKNDLPTLSIYRPKESNGRASEIFRTDSNRQNATIDIIEIPPMNTQQRETRTEAFKTTEAKFDSVVIKAGELLQYYCQNAGDDFTHWKLQYAEICQTSKESKRSHEVAHLPHNKKKNRYKDVYPFDDSRVILAGDEENDYINASYVQGYRNPRKFIAAQGPKRETIDDFWRMVWQEHTCVVVMLTNLVESGKSKCAKYWPDKGETMTCGDYDVTSLDEVQIGGVVRRDLTISDDLHKRQVYQLQYTSWPDHDIPVVTSTMMYLRHMVEELNCGKPIVVHCSAGAGRTGTYIGMDVLVDELNATGQVNAMRATLKMRENRSDMIQTAKQYVFVHRLLVEHHFNPNSDRSLEEFRDITANMWPSIIQNEFERLELFQRLHEATSKANPYDDDPNVVTVFDSTLNDEVNMNAHYIEDRSFSRLFIASEGPDSNPELFWSMVLQCNALTVLELEEPKSGTSISSLVENDRVMFGDVSIDVMTVHYREGFVLQELYLQQAGGVSEPVVVTHICGLQWTDSHNPPQPTTLLSAMDAIDLFVSEETVRRPKLLVHCSDGCTRTGMFIALMNCIERLKSQQRIDIFRAVEDLRSIKPNMAKGQEMYEYCYDVMLLYASIFDT